MCVCTTIAFLYPQKREKTQVCRFLRLKSLNAMKEEDHIPSERSSQGEREGIFPKDTA